MDDKPVGVNDADADAFCHELCEYLNSRGLPTKIVGIALGHFLAVAIATLATDEADVRKGIREVQNGLKVAALDYFKDRQAKNMREAQRASKQ